MRCFSSANRNYADNAIAMHVRGMSRSMQSHADKVISPKFGDENKSFERKVGQEKHVISQTKNTTHPHFARQSVEENHFENMYVSTSATQTVSYWMSFWATYYDSIAQWFNDSKVSAKTKRSIANIGGR